MTSKTVDVTAVIRGDGGESWRGRAALFAVVFAGFAAGALLSWESFGSTVGPSFFYPAAGVTASALMLSRRSAWPVVVAAVVTAELLVDTLYGNPPFLSVVFASANVVEPMVGASVVLAWCGGRPDLRRRRDFVGFLAGACLAGPLAGSLIGGTASSIHGGASWPLAVLNWWGGDALGVLVVAAPVLLWSTQSYVVRRRPWETAAVLAVTAGLSFTAFWSQVPPSMLILPVLAWAALRLDMLGAAIAGALAAFLANIMATHGRGLFRNVDASPATRVALTQVFVATIVVVAMLIALESAARLRAVRDGEAERRERMRLQTLSRLAQRLAGALNPYDVGRALVDEVLDETGASAVCLGVVSADGRTLEWITTSGYPQQMVEEFGDGIALTERSVVTDAVRFGKPIAIHSAAEYQASYPGRVRLDKPSSVVGWPLVSGGDVFGALQLVWSDPQPVSLARQAYVSAVATMVSQALVRARAYVDERARAAVLQSAVLPRTPIDTNGLATGVLYEPADVARIGGDWYDIMALGVDRTYLAVGDIVGHGLTAVEDMVQLRCAGRAFAHQGRSPALMLADLNGFAADIGQGEFATMVAAVFDHDSGLLSYCSAGHPPPFLRRGRSGEVVRLADANGPVLGPFGDSVYSEGTVRIQPGDVLLMYTDGLVEHSGRDVQAGIAHLEQVIATTPPEVLLDCEALADRAAPSPRIDDICLLVVHFAADRAGAPARVAGIDT